MHEYAGSEPVILQKLLLAFLSSQSQSGATEDECGLLSLFHLTSSFLALFVYEMLDMQLMPNAVAKG